MTSKLRQHSVSSVRKLQELVHECNVTLASYRTSLQNLGTIADSPQLRREVETNGRACMRAAEAAKTSVMPQLRHEGVEFTRHASQFIACLSAMLVELKRCEALLATFPLGDAPLGGDIAAGEAMLEALENLITVHFSTSECSPADKVTPRRRRGNPCRPGCCSRLKTSYA